MKIPDNIPWARILAESVAIVASILLAFAIDAWWDDRGERKLEAVLVADLYTDFQASQAHLEDWLTGNRQILKDNTLLVEQLRATAPGEALEVELGWIVSVIGTPTYSPTDATFQALVASGRLELLQDHRLRKGLTNWRQLIDDTQEDELMVRKLVLEKVNPAFARQLRLAESFRFELITGRFAGNSVPDPERKLVLTATSDLEGALAERLFYQTFVVDGLQKLQEKQAELLGLLEANMSR